MNDVDYCVNDIACLYTCSCSSYRSCNGDLRDYSVLFKIKLQIPRIHYIINRRCKTYNFLTCSSQNSDPSLLLAVASSLNQKRTLSHRYPQLLTILFPIRKFWKIGIASAPIHTYGIFPLNDFQLIGNQPNLNLTACFFLYSKRADN